MSSSVGSIAAVCPGVRNCSYCAEEIRVDAKKCKHCGAFVNKAISKTVGMVFGGGVVFACILAGTQATPSEAILVVGVWAIFALLFAQTFTRS